MNFPTQNINRELNYKSHIGKNVENFYNTRTSKGHAMSIREEKCIFLVNQEMEKIYLRFFHTVMCIKIGLEEIVLIYTGKCRTN